MMVRSTLLLALGLIALGSAVGLLNYERHSIALQQEGRVELADYHAPGWDPFPHHLKVSSVATSPVSLLALIDGVEERRTLASGGEEVFHVQPGERLTVYLEPTSAGGVVRTTLWCDSWSYAAITLILAGTAVLALYSASTLGAR